MKKLIVLIITIALSAAAGWFAHPKPPPSPEPFLARFVDGTTLTVRASPPVICTRRRCVDRTPENRRKVEAD